jgi:hypothetical protein
VADIFQEVDEEVRRDKAKVLWRKYGVYVIIICVGIVLGTASRVLWREYKVAQQTEESGRYIVSKKLLDEGNAAEALSSFQSLASEANTGYGTIAKFQAVIARVKTGDKAGAVAELDLIAADNAIDPIFRGLANLQAVMLLVDNGDSEDLRRRITYLLEKDSPWRYSGLEMQAILNFRDGDLDSARSKFKAISEDAGAPMSMRNRAKQLVAALGGED